MSVGVGTKTNVKVNIAARSFSYTASELIRLLTNVPAERGLPLDYMVEQGKVIEDGLRAWLMGRFLTGIRLEIWNPSTGKAVEAYRFDVTYTPVKSETYASKVDDVLSALKDRPKLNGDLKYRVIAHLADGAPKVPGWSSTKCRDLSHLKSKKLGQAVDSAACNVDIELFTEEDNESP